MFTLNHLNDPFLSDFCEPQKYNLNLGEGLHITSETIFIVNRDGDAVGVWEGSCGRNIVFGAK